MAGLVPSLDDTGSSLAVEQSLHGLCPKHSPLWEPPLLSILVPGMCRAPLLSILVPGACGAQGSPGTRVHAGPEHARACTSL